MSVVGGTGEEWMDKKCLSDTELLKRSLMKRQSRQNGLCWKCLYEMIVLLCVAIHREKRDEAAREQGVLLDFVGSREGSVVFPDIHGYLPKSWACRCFQWHAQRRGHKELTNHGRENEENSHFVELSSAR